MTSQSASESREVDWGGCLLTDRGSVDEIDTLIGNEVKVMGERGTVEAIWLIEGRTPWPGPPWPRPLYRESGSTRPRTGSTRRKTLTRR